MQCESRPHAVDNRSVAIQAYHVILLGHRVQVGQFVVGEERVWNPDLVGEVTSQRHIVVTVVGERQTFVLPVLVQIDGDRVVLHAHTVEM